MYIKYTIYLLLRKKNKVYFENIYIGTSQKYNICIINIKAYTRIYPTTKINKIIYRYNEK